MRCRGGRAYYHDAEEWCAHLITDPGLPVGALRAADREALWRRVCAAHIAWKTVHLVQDHAGSDQTSADPL
jgi:hypothetical protein